MTVPNVFRRCGYICIFHLVVVLSCAIPGSALDWSGTILQSNGTVSVNGQSIRGSHTLLKGDVVATETGTALLMLHEGTATVGENSSVRLEPSTLIVNSGEALIHARKGLLTKFQNFKLRSSRNESTGSIFRIGTQNGKARIAVLRGSLFVDYGENQVLLTEGQGLEGPVSGETGNSVRSTARTGAGWTRVLLAGTATGGTLGALTARGHNGTPAGPPDKHCVSHGPKCP